MRALLIIIAGLTTLCGCVNPWHTESYFDQRAYQHPDAASLREDLNRTLNFLPSIGLKQHDQVKDAPPATEAVFIRDLGDHFHVTVTVRGLAQVDGTGWTMLVRVDSYDIGEEGAVAAGQSMLSEIDTWHQTARPLPVVVPQPASTQ
jgi:hypothetical protein